MTEFNAEENQKTNEEIKDVNNNVDRLKASQIDSSSYLRNKKKTNRIALISVAIVLLLFVVLMPMKEKPSKESKLVYLNSLEQMTISEYHNSLPRDEISTPEVSTEEVISIEPDTTSTKSEDEDEKVRKVAEQVYNDLLKIENILYIAVQTSDAEGAKTEVHYPLVKMQNLRPTERNDATYHYSSCFSAISDLDAIYKAFGETSGIKRVQKVEKYQSFYDEDIQWCKEALEGK